MHKLSDKSKKALSPGKKGWKKSKQKIGPLSKIQIPKQI